MTRRLVAITDPRYDTEHLVATVRRLPRGLCVVQYRDTRGPTEETARRLLAAARESGSLFVVNGDVDLAAHIGADGVHLGGPSPDVARARARIDGWVSVAAHDDDAVARAVREGATAALVSPIFPTPGHGPPRGTGALQAARAVVGDRLLLYALGGVDGSSAAACAEAGADGVAAIRAVFEGELEQLVQPFPRP